jgi:hypothetical protein
VALINHALPKAMALLDMNAPKPHFNFRQSTTVLRFALIL